jgi:peptidoglycan/xylan/chitin deacetylase (PgdA/CDA1 family)
MLRLPLSLLSPAGTRARLSIMIFHRVLAHADPLFPETPTAEEFEQQMRWVRSWFQVLPLREAVDRLYAGTLPARALSVSFDDGYADNEAIAAPILGRLGLNATFFVSTGFLDGGCMWNDCVIEAVRNSAAAEIDLRSFGLAQWPLGGDAQRRQVILAILAGIKRLEPDRRQAVVEGIVEATGHSQPPALMMRPEQLRTLRRLGMDVGAHTVTHPILARLNPGAAREEIARSKADLENVLGEPVTLFAYPNGVPGNDYAAEHAAMVRECGFAAAVSTAWGSATRRSDPFQLPRFTPWDRTSIRYGVRMLHNLTRTESVAA